MTGAAIGTVNVARGSFSTRMRNIAATAWCFMPGNQWKTSPARLSPAAARGPRSDPDVIIKRAYLDLLGREPDSQGRRDYRGLILDQGWTEAMVRDNIRRGDEFRREGAERIVCRAYLDVLGREVDPEGLRHFRTNLLEKNWTEGDVRDALRNSEEYRKSGGRR